MAAEMAVSFAIDHLLPLLTEEATMLRGIHKGFADIKDELESIQAFLKDADRRAAAGEGDNTTEGVKTWVKQVREVAFRIEDIIDDYIIHIGQQQQQEKQPACAALICKIADLVKTFKSRHQIASEIQDIKSCVREIKDRSGRYSFQPQQEGPSSRGNLKWLPHREAALYMEEAQVVGFEAPREKLIGWLVQGRAERTVVSVVAMGGQGKTTLAKKVFENQEVIKHFDCHAWITVSQSYSVEGLLREMLQQFCKDMKQIPPNDISTMDRSSLFDALRDCLQQKRYVVVFDDVWNILFWDDIQFGMLDNNNGSRILITTRDMEVAMSCRKSAFVEVHKLQPLTFDQSLKLFYRKAFQFDFDGRCPKDLSDISHVIVKKCNGLPLAIVAIGGALSIREKHALEWERFNQNLSEELERNPHLDDIKKILGFSYDDLPYHLKACFLYFGTYPEDYGVRSRRLILQWIAEGFVKEERLKNLEKVGKEYLRELVRRSLVLVSEGYPIKGVRVKYYRVHDVMREMILTKSKELSFGQFIGKGDESMSVSSRRLSLATASDVLMRSNEMSSPVRSLHFFTDELHEYVWRRIPTKYKQLKVLDSEDVSLHNVPDNIGNLILLKYLSLNGIASLPKSISNLQNLETLNIRGENIFEIPKEVSKLRRLRHLLGEKISLTQLKDDIGGMTSLQTLDCVKIENDDVELIRELRKLWQLRVLGFFSTKHLLQTTFSSLLNEKPHLEKLFIFSYVFSDLNLMSPDLPMLQKLHIHKELDTWSQWVPQLQNLVNLVLIDSRLLDDSMKSLQNLPNLLSLTLNDCYGAESLHFQGGGFQKLEELHLEDVSKLESIFIYKGSLPSLKRLWLWELRKLRILLPSRIHRLYTHVAIDIRYTSVELIQEELS